MPRSKASEAAEKLLIITLELNQATHDPQQMKSLLIAREELLSQLESTSLDADAKRILSKVQDAEGSFLSTLHDWRSAIVCEAGNFSKRRAAVQTYARTA